MHTQLPPELLKAVYTWTGDPVRRMGHVYRVTRAGISRYVATDGHRYVSVSMPADAGVSEGAFAVAPDGSETAIEDAPPCCSARFLADAVNIRPKSAGKWSINPTYFGAMAGVEKALAAYVWRTAREDAKARGERKRAVAGRTHASFTLAGELDPLVATAHGGECSVTMLIMPRRI